MKHGIRTLATNTIKGAVGMACALGTDADQVRVRLAASGEGWVLTAEDIDLSAALSDPLYIGRTDRRLALRACEHMVKAIRNELARRKDANARRDAA